jgi:hypothetical protein
LSPFNNGSTFVVLKIHNTPQLPIWARWFQMPFSIHGASFTFFFDQLFENLAHHEIFPTGSPLSWLNATCPFVDKGH